MSARTETNAIIQEKAKHFRAWCESLPPGRWSLYRGLMSEATRRQIPFAIGGGLSLMVYAGQLRDTKDIDIYVQPQHREAMIQVVLDAGLTDYYERAPYDRNWIFRGFRDNLIVDVIWAMANQRAQVDPEWLDGPSVLIDELTFRLLRPEEALWGKLYVLQRDRCDWPDALSMLYSIGTELDWARLLNRVAEDMPLLAALVRVFRWICPERCDEFPQAVLQQLGIAESLSKEVDFHSRARLLDSRPWFTPTLGEEKRL